MRCDTERRGSARSGERDGTIIKRDQTGVVKKSKNQAGIVVRTRGTEKARKIGAALFSVWFHRRRRLQPDRRRWSPDCAEWKIRLSPSLPPPWEEDAKIDDSEHGLSGGGRGRGKGFRSILLTERDSIRRGEETRFRRSGEQASGAVRRETARRGAAWNGAARRGAEAKK